ncbi:MAG: DUF305 domain-containing protein [Flavobacteriales bacterium]|nr:DUF305 domain-containing protein [Flavobacteriales bacterium]MCB9178304.1 DUF305 domain-containing protein [Flavobacteriales bacterium]HPF91349.1 DUF305 domain-containing protein [Flavobacteriales bacterium]
MEHSPYPKFFLMLAISFVIMYAVMFLNVADSGHIRLSLTRTYMALLMVAPMAWLMLVMMGHMYPDRARNRAIAIGAALVFVLALVGLRTQVPIGDAQYMKAMIPHHSSAILTSRNASINDPRVRDLADRIIEAQVREIAEMDSLLKQLDH